MLRNITDILYQKWKNGFLKLEEEIDIFEAKFNQIKECECEIEDCSHFKNERHRIFGEKIDYLFNLRLQVSLSHHKFNN